MGPFLDPTPMGNALAAAMVVAGAPLFGAGLRNLRLRRHLERLEESPLGEEPTGFVLVRGRVALESPLVGPLSGLPCAGFLLEVRGAGGAVMATIEDRRAFRITGSGVTARVTGGETRAWALSITEQRAVAPTDTLSQNLVALLAKSAEASWLRRCGVTITLVERALLAGQECHVVGSARHARPYELSYEAELARTGTDNLPVRESRSRVSRDPDLWIEADGHLDYLRISDHAPSAAELAVGRLGIIGVALGPMLGLAGLLYLARAADLWRAPAGF